VEELEEKEGSLQLPVYLSQAVQSTPFSPAHRKKRKKGRGKEKNSEVRWLKIHKRKSGSKKGGRKERGEIHSNSSKIRKFHTFSRKRERLVHSAGSRRGLNNHEGGGGSTLL